MGVREGAERRNGGTSERRNIRTSERRNGGNHGSQNAQKRGAHTRAPFAETAEDFESPSHHEPGFLLNSLGTQELPEAVPIFSNESGVRRRHCQASPFCAFARDSGRSARSAIRGSRRSVVPKF